MKKLLTLMLGLSLVFGCVATSLAQDTPKKDGGKRKTSKKKVPKTPKKDGGE